MFKSTILVLFLCFLTPKIWGQETSFSYDIKGLHPNYLVVEMEGMSQVSQYKKLLSWAKVDNRELKSSEEPSKIVFQGGKENALCFTVMGKTSCNNMRYTVEVAFKDNKYKFEVISLEQFGPVNDTGKKDWFPVLLEKAPDAWYNRNGELKKEYVSSPGDISGLFNDLVQEVKKGLLKENSGEKEDGW